MKRMRHLQHGFHYAHNTLEEDAMLKNGWVDDEPKDLPVRTGADMPHDVIEVTVDAEPIKRGRRAKE